LEVVTTDASGNLASDGGFIYDELDKHKRGIAMAVALTGGASLRGNESMALSMDLGFFDDEVAGALSGIAHVATGEAGQNVYFKGGVAVTQGDFAGRAGLQLAW